MLVVPLAQPLDLLVSRWFPLTSDFSSPSLLLFSRVSFSLKGVVTTTDLPKATKKGGKRVGVNHVAFRDWATIALRMLVTVCAVLVSSIPELGGGADTPRPLNPQSTLTHVTVLASVPIGAAQTFSQTVHLTNRWLTPEIAAPP